MMRITLVFVFGCFASFLFAQDAYHLDLVQSLKNKYNLENGTFVFSDNEIKNNEDFYIYGSSTKVLLDAVDLDFSKKTKLAVSQVGINKWDAGIGIGNKKTISKDDIILLVFWARKISSNSDLSLFIEDATNYEKEVYTDISFTQDWSEYLVAFKASKTFGVNNLSFGFHTAGAIQEFEIGGYTAFNFAQQYPLDDFPSIYNPNNYGGSEIDAPWRAEAANRIEEIRKADLTVKVIDNKGNEVPSALVEVEMTKHAFGFGSALVTCRFPGNNCYNPLYLEKIQNLDGKGHGFNIAVTENALKWNGWEQEWLGTPTETKSAISYLLDRDIEVRGHTLIWPGWGNLPPDMQQNKNNINYLKTRIKDRIDLMLNDDIIGTNITEWDVLNEITTNRDIEFALKGKESYETGREIYLEIFNQISTNKPNHKNYINDYIVLSNGGFGETTTNRYKQFLSEISDSGAKLDGIGFQCHIGPFPTSIIKIKETLDEFDALYDVEFKVTEYDIDGKVDPEVQAKYMRDFLTIIFSHPKMTAFLMWGFYDGNHWKGNAPMFDVNWNLKPSGEAFNDLVFNQWWTNESGNSDTSGEFKTRVFKGDHKITVTYNGESIEQEVTIDENNEVTVQLLISNTIQNEIKSFQISPNPNSGSFQIDLPENFGTYNIEIRSIENKLVFENKDQTSKSILTNLPSGVYTVQLVNGKQEKLVSKVIVL